MTERSELLASLNEARLRLENLTRELDESPAAEEDPTFEDKLQKVHECVLELERALRALNN
jgi:exonuclease VII small subunit